MFNVEAGAAVNSERWLATFYRFSPSIADLLRFSIFDVFFAYDGAKSYNAVLWTMPVELAGSILVFGMLAIFGRHLKPLVYVVVGIVLAMLNSQLIAFLFGVALSHFYSSPHFEPVARSRWTTLFSLPALIAVIAFSTFGRRYYDSPLLLSLAAFLVVAAVACDGRMQRLFSTRISSFLGKISFPLYLVHLPLIASLSSWLYLTCLAAGMSAQAAANIMVAVSLAAALLAAVLFQPVETFSIRVARAVSSYVLKPAGYRATTRFRESQAE